jgi:hypothetical protein
LLHKELDDRLAARRLKPEWRVLLTDLDRLHEIEVEQDGKHFIPRTPVSGVAGKVFQAVGVALPRPDRPVTADRPAHRFLGQPYGQAASPHQRGIVVWPVRHPVSGLRDLVAAAFVELARHGFPQTHGDGRRSYRPGINLRAIRF